MFMDDRQRPNGWHIVSYPRSGNHIVRALLEYASGRPTMGCPGTRHDPPISDRQPNRKKGLIRITNSEPIGWKAHYPRELFLNQKNSSGCGVDIRYSVAGERHYFPAI